MFIKYFKKEKKTNKRHKQARLYITLEQETQQTYDVFETYKRRLKDVFKTSEGRGNTSNIGVNSVVWKKTYVNRIQQQAEQKYITMSI